MNKERLQPCVFMWAEGGLSWTHLLFGGLIHLYDCMHLMPNSSPRSPFACPSYTHPSPTILPSFKPIMEMRTCIDSQTQTNELTNMDRR